MSIRRVIRCDVCFKEQQEKEPDEGWPNWMQLTGVMLNSAANPNLCPTCCAEVMQSVDALAQRHIEGG